MLRELKLLVLLHVMRAHNITLIIMKEPNAQLTYFSILQGKTKMSLDNFALGTCMMYI